MIGAGALGAGIVMPTRRTPITRLGMVLNYGGEPWKAGMVAYPIILPNPNDPSRLWIYLTGVAVPVASSSGSLGRYSAPVGNPLDWTPDPGFVYTSATASYSLDSIVVEGDLLYIYMTDNTSKVIDLFTSPLTDGLTLTKHPASPVLTPTGQGRDDGNYVSQCFTMKIGSTWHHFYSWRGSTTLSGPRHATSPDGINLTKVGSGNLWSVGPGKPYTTYIEGCTVVRIGGKLVSVFSAYNASVNEWTICLASADDPAGPWVESALNPFYRRSDISGAYDQTQLATPLLCQINGRWYLFVQAGGQSGAYIDVNYAMGAAVLAGSPLDFI